MTTTSRLVFKSNTMRRGAYDGLFGLKLCWCWFALKESARFVEGDEMFR